MNLLMTKLRLMKVLKIIMLLLMCVEVTRMQCRILELDSSESLQQDELNNCCNDNYDPSSEQIGKFRDSVKWIKEFKDSFYYAILYAILYQLKSKKEECQNDTLSNLKENLRLDLDIQNFENSCHSVQKMLNKNGLLLRFTNWRINLAIWSNKTLKRRLFWENYLAVSSKCSTVSILFTLNLAKN